jgi:hypothetical protein
LFALLLAAAAAAQVRVLPPSVLMPLGVPALLVGTPGAPAPALSAAFAVQAQALAPLSAPQAVAYLTAAAASPQPAVAAAARLAVALAPPVAAAAGLEPVAKAARADPALAAWFDGGAAPSLGLDGLTATRRGWSQDGAPLDRLGQGDFGFVDAHRAVPGAVVKTVAHSVEVHLMMGPSAADTAAQEQTTARALAAADAGPRHFGRARLAGREVSVRERVYGDTFDALTRAKKFGAEEQALIEDLLARLADAGLKPDDMRPANIMIGHTLMDPRRRAYLVDGGRLQAVPAGLDAAGRRQDLLDFYIVLKGRMDPNMGWVETARSLREMMADARERSSRDTRWKRIRGFWKDLGRAFVP